MKKVTILLVLGLLIVPILALAEEKICDIRFKDGLWKKYIILDINWNGVEGVEYDLYKNTPNPDAVFINRDDIDYILCDTAITLPPPPPSLRSQQLLSSLDSSLSTMRNFKVGGGLTIITRSGSSYSSVPAGLGFNIYIDHEIGRYFTFRTSVGRYATGIEEQGYYLYCWESNYCLLWIEESILYTVFRQGRGKRNGITAYVGCGVGYYIIDYGRGPRLQILKKDTEEETYLITRQKVDNVFSPHGRVGVTLTGKISLNVDMKYAFIKPNVTTSEELIDPLEYQGWAMTRYLLDSIEDKEEIDLKALFFNIGLTINF